MARGDTLASQAYQAIRVALLHERLRPDAFYSENSIAGMLGISRTPAREALQQLEIEGLIEILPQRGFRVRRISAAEIEEFYSVRALLESYVVRTLCGRIDERSLRLLGHILERQEMASDNVTEFISIDEEFHLSLAQLAGLDRTARIVASLRGVLWLMGTRIVEAESRRRDVVIGEHAAILHALEHRDADAAVAAITRHIRMTETAAAASSSAETVRA